jgi:hypothetical protein
MPQILTCFDKYKIESHADRTCNGWGVVLSFFAIPWCEHFAVWCVYVAYPVGQARAADCSPRAHCWMRVSTSRTRAPGPAARRQQRWRIKIAGSRGGDEVHQRGATDHYLYSLKFQGSAAGLPSWWWKKSIMDEQLWEPHCSGSRISCREGGVAGLAPLAGAEPRRRRRFHLAVGLGSRWESRAAVLGVGGRAARGTPIPAKRRQDNEAWRSGDGRRRCLAGGAGHADRGISWWMGISWWSPFFSHGETYLGCFLLDRACGADRWALCPPHLLL